MKKPSVLFINRVYPPSSGATGRVLRDLAQAFSRDGWDVTVLTTGDTASVTLDGAVRVNRIKVAAGKTPWKYALAWTKLLWAGLRMPKHRMVVTLTDPPLVVAAGRIIARFKKSSHIHWVQDLYPDILPVLGMNIPEWGMNILRGITRRAMRSCDRVVVIGRCMAKHLAYTGFDMAKVSVIPNWPDFELTPAAKMRVSKPIHTPKTKAVLAGRDILRNHPIFVDEAPKFRVLYSGNLGRAHPISTILDAAEILMETNPEIEFVFAGDGANFERIAEARARRGLDNVRLLPPQPLSRLKDLMEGGDVHLISMKHEAAGMLVPSKLYAALATGRPCIFIGPDHAETAKVIREFGAGAVVSQGQAQKLAHEILSFRNDGNIWFAAQTGALRAGEQFVPANSISTWIKGAREALRYRVA